MAKLDIYHSPDVYEPPSGGNLDQSIHEDVRGSIHRLNISGFSVNLLFTKAGFMRSGDIHKDPQNDFIFEGRVEIWTREDGQDVKRVFGPNSFITLPPHIPHLFNFLEDTVMAEWWDGPFKTWYYRPYREIIGIQFKLKTQG